MELSRNALHLLPIASMVLVLFVAPEAQAQSGGGYDLSHNVVAGGGATTVTGSGFTHGGTIGQSHAGQSSDPTYTIVAGFWAGLSLLATTPTPGTTATSTASAPPSLTPSVASTTTLSFTPTPTLTQIVPFSPTPTTTGKGTSTATPTFAPTTASPTPVVGCCAGDCSGDGEVSVDELVLLVNIALGNTAESNCLLGDVDGDGQITIDEIDTAVNRTLHGCTQETTDGEMFKPVDPCPAGDVSQFNQAHMACTLRVAESTTRSIGFEWDLQAGSDADHDATCDVEYRIKGADCGALAPGECGTATLVRVDYQGWNCAGDSCSGPFDICSNDFNRGYAHFNMFAGSLMSLHPGTSYEVTLTAKDGGTIVAKKQIEIATRPEPTLSPTREFQISADGSCAFDMSSRPGSNGVSTPLSCFCAVNPSAPDCGPNVCNGSSLRPFRSFADAETCAQPGDVFMVHSGMYEGHEFKTSGEAGKYIAWKGAGDGSISLQSPLVVLADHLWFEGLSLSPATSNAPAIAGIIGALKPPAPGVSCPCGLSGSCDQEGGCDCQGTDDIVVLGNQFSNLQDAVVLGCWDGHTSGNLSWDRFNKGRSRNRMHRHWYIADNVASAENLTSASLIHLSFAADSEVAYNRISMTQQRPAGGWPSGSCDPVDSGKVWTCPYGNWCFGPRCICGREEPDGVKINSTTNVDVYGNDIRDIPDDAIEADGSYANVRVWRNRVIHAGGSFLSLQPMDAAPWYAVRNEFIGYPGSCDAADAKNNCPGAHVECGTSPGQPTDDSSPCYKQAHNAATALKANIFDRLVLVNNTFVLRNTKSAQSHADVLLRSISRNNLWVHTFLADNNFGGFMWDGRGSESADNQELDESHGQSHGDWKTDLDFDGFDWVPLSDAFQKGLALAGETTSNLTVRWLSNTDSGCNHGMSEYLSFASQPPQESVQASLRGCAGGAFCDFQTACCAPASGCSSCAASPFNEKSCSLNGGECGTYECRAVEENWRRVRREKIFNLNTDAAIDAYALTPFSANRLDLQDCTSDTLACQDAEGQSCCPIDKGDAEFYNQNQFYLRDVPIGQPDLGAYERGQPTPGYGPRGL